jgi:hypothetical protein
VLGVTVVSDDSVGTTKTTVSEASNGITAYGIQIRFRSGDPTPAPTTDDSVSVLCFARERLETDSPLRAFD